MHRALELVFLFVPRVATIHGLNSGRRASISVHCPGVCECLDSEKIKDRRACRVHLHPVKKEVPPRIWFDMTPLRRRRIQPTRGSKGERNARSEAQCSDSGSSTSAAEVQNLWDSSSSYGAPKSGRAELVSEGSPTLNEPHDLPNLFALLSRIVVHTV